MLMKLTTYRGQFHHHFTHADSKSVKDTYVLTVFFMLLGSTCVNAVRKMLMKLTAGRISLRIATLYPRLGESKVNKI